MLKGEKPYDQKAFAAHAAEVASAARHNFLGAFPEESEDAEETDAKAEVWMNWEDFEQKFQALQTESAALAKVASAGGQDATAQQFSKTGKACKACHKEYKN